MYTERHVREGLDAATDAMQLAVHVSAVMMRGPESGTEDDDCFDVWLPLHLTLRDGFRGHAVVILVDGKMVYHRDALTTDPLTSRADAVDLEVASRKIEVAVAVTPGEYVGSVSLDVGTHPHLTISLIGEGTIGFEISTHFRR